METDPFIIRMSISHYRALLNQELNKTKREMLNQLIAQFKARLPDSEDLSAR